MRGILRGMAVAVYGILMSTQLSFAGVPGCEPDCGPPPAAVPEPGTLAILATGLGILALARFRKRK